MSESARATVAEPPAKAEKARAENRPAEESQHPTGLQAQILYQQRTIGNRAVQRLIEKSPLPGRAAIVHAIQRQQARPTAKASSQDTTPGLGTLRTKEVQDLINEKDYQGAIDTLINFKYMDYEIDMNLLEGKGMKYDPGLTSSDGVTAMPSWDWTSNPPKADPAKVRIGPSAFSSVAYLYSVIMHEYQHVLWNQTLAHQQQSNRENLSKSGSSSEVEASAWELLHGEESGISLLPDKVTQIWNNLNKEFWTLDAQAQAKERPLVLQALNKAQQFTKGKQTLDPFRPPSSSTSEPQSGNTAVASNDQAAVPLQQSPINRVATSQGNKPIKSEAATTLARKIHHRDVQGSGALTIQRAWYNISIPFTDYELDPSWEGVKTAAGVVKDAAVSAFDWIVDKIKGLVSDAWDWLTEKWHDLENLVASAMKSVESALGAIVRFFLGPLGALASAIMSLDSQAVDKAWKVLSGIVNSVSNGFKATIDGLLEPVNKLWSVINGFASSTLNSITWLFDKLPGVLQKVAQPFVDKIKGLWKSINDWWTENFNKLKAWADSAVDKVFGFVRKILSFGINVVVQGILQFGQLILFLKDLFSNPQKYVEILAQKSVHALDGVESRFAGEASKYFGSSTRAQPANASTAIHRQAAADEAKETKGSSSWGEIGSGVLEMMGKKWKEFKADPWSVIKNLLIDMIFPLIGNIKDVVKLFHDIKKIVTGPLSAGSLEEFWTSLLLILHIPILIYNTIVGILGRSLFLPLIVASFVRHPLVTAIASAVGWGLLGAFIQGEVANIAHELLLLRTGATTKSQKDDAYNSVADSLIGMAMAAIAIVIIIILHFIGNVIRGVYNFVKSKIFPAERPGPEVKPEVKPDEKPGVKPTVLEVDPADLKYSEPSYDSGAWRWNLYDAKSGARFCNVEVKAPSSTGRPPGGPELELDPKNATLPDGTKVTLKARGFGWTNESLKLSLKAFKEKFGFDAPELSGEIDWDNLANFQNEFEQIRTAQPGLDPQAVGVEAAKRISFGKARIKLGYDQFDVKMSNFGDVTLEYGGEGVKGKTLHNVPKDVRIEARPSGGGSKE